jgi:MFS transporter, DHA1 family, inner membrane transport protein
MGTVMQGNNIGLMVGPAAAGAIAAAYQWTAVALLVATLALAASALIRCVQVRSE